MISRQDARHPASPAQRGLWLIDRTADPQARPAYLVPTVLEFTGPVDRPALRDAVAAVLARHPALRSRFELDPDRSRVVYRTDGPPPPVTVLEPPDVDAHLAVACWMPFDLAVDAPARAEVLAAGERTVLLICAHHLVLDGWSRQVLLDQVGDAYRAAVDGRDAELPEPVHPATQAGDTGPDESRTAQAVQRLRGAPVDVQLRPDRPRPEVATTRGATCAGSFGPALTAKLLDRGTEQGCTPFMLVAALLAATLAERGDQRDFLFAFPWLGRDTEASRHGVGMYVNTLLLRADLTGGPSWAEFLGRVRDACLAAYGDADVPFDAIAARLHPDRDLSRPPVTPVMVNALGPLALPDLGPGVAARQLPLPDYRVRYELELDVTPAGDDMLLALDYAVDLFDRGSVEALLETLRRKAGELVADPAAPVLDEAADHGPSSPQTPPSGSVAAAGADADDDALVDEVRQAWREVLDKETVPLEQNFFEAGGNSLLLVVLLDRLNALTDRELVSADLFKSPTVASQARLLGEPPDGVRPGTGGGRGQLLERGRRARGGGRPAAGAGAPGPL